MLEHGQGAVTPNFHQLLHVPQQIRDTGPPHVVWLYSYERFNYRLQQMLNNAAMDSNVQILNKFLMAQAVSGLSESAPEICSIFSHKSGESCTKDYVSQYLMFKSVLSNVCDYSNLSLFTYKLTGLLSNCNSSTLEYLHHMCRKMYPEKSITCSNTYRNIKYIKICNYKFVSNNHVAHGETNNILSFYTQGTCRKSYGTMIRLMVHDCIVENVTKTHIVAIINEHPTVASHHFGEEEPVIMINASVSHLKFVPIQHVICNQVTMMSDESSDHSYIYCLNEL